MQDAPYNTKVGIEREYLADLAGLQRLFQDRSKAYDSDRTSLDEFIIFGRWMLDSCANVGRCSFRLKGAKGEFSDTLTRSLEKVTPVKALRSVLSVSIETEIGLSAPKPDDICPVCAKGWTLETTGDSVFTRDRVFHQECLAFHQSVESRKYYTELFTEAGYEHFVLDEIPNEYCGCEVCSPWTLARTQLGLLKIGWRKRVLNIDWAATKAKGIADLFKDEQVTVGETHVHAYGRAKAIEYLRKIRERQCPIATV